QGRGIHGVDEGLPVVPQDADVDGDRREDQDQDEHEREKDEHLAALTLAALAAWAGTPGGKKRAASRRPRNEGPSAHSITIRTVELRLKLVPKSSGKKEL